MANVFGIDAINGTSKRELDAYDWIKVDGESKPVTVVEFLSESRYERFGTPAERYALLNTMIFKDLSGRNLAGSLPICADVTEYASKLQNYWQNHRRTTFWGKTEVAAQLRASHLTREDAIGETSQVKICDGILPGRTERGPVTTWDLRKKVNAWCAEHGWSVERFFEFNESLGNYKINDLGTPRHFREKTECPADYPTDLSEKDVVLYFPSDEAVKTLGPVNPAS